MPARDTGITKAREVFTEHGGMLRTSKALRLGIHPRTLDATKAGKRRLLRELSHRPGPDRQLSS